MHALPSECAARTLSPPASVTAALDAVQSARKKTIQGGPHARLASSTAIAHATSPMQPLETACSSGRPVVRAYARYSSRRESGVIDRVKAERCTSKGGVMSPETPSRAVLATVAMLASGSVSTSRPKRMKPTRSPRTSPDQRDRIAVPCGSSDHCSLTWYAAPMTMLMPAQCISSRPDMWPCSCDTACVTTTKAVAIGSRGSPQCLSSSITETNTAKRYAMKMLILGAFAKTSSVLPSARETRRRSQTSEGKGARRIGMCHIRCGRQPGRARAMAREKCRNTARAC
eukprot:6182475-Pleurochrysis_carterae.AAC.4